MKFSSILLIILFANTLFADKLIIHELTSGNTPSITKVYVSQDFIKIENEKFGLIYERNQQDLSFYSLKSRTYLSATFKEFKNEYQDYAQIILEELGSNETTRTRLIQKINNDSAFIQNDSIKISDFRLNNLIQKKIGRKKILDFKCNNIVFSNDTGEVSRVYFSDKLISESLIDLQYAWKLFNKMDKLIGNESLLSYEYFGTQKKLYYPMYVKEDGGKKEEVVIIDDIKIGPNEIEVFTGFRKLTLIDLVLSIKDTQKQ